MVYNDDRTQKITTQIKSTTIRLLRRYHMALYKNQKS